jgi:hypothetical protein
LDARDSAQIYDESKTTHLAGGFAAEEFFGRGKNLGCKAVHANNRFNASIPALQATRFCLVNLIECSMSRPGNQTGTIA